MALTPDTDQFSQFLRLAFLRSPNFVTGVSGWTINQDGSAEFNNVVVRGTLSSANFFVYSPSEGAGNLIASAGEANTDKYGNKTIPGGFATYNNGLGVALAYQSNGLFGYTGSLAAGWTLGQSSVTQDGHATSVQGRLIGLITGSNAVAIRYISPSGDVTGATDIANINGSLNGSGGFVQAGETRLLAGQYYINAAITVPTNNSLTGAGAGATVINQKANAAEGITCTNVSTVTLRGFTLVGNGSGVSTAAGIHFASNPPTANHILDDIIVQNFGLQGFLFDSVFLTELRKCEALANGGNGFQVTNSFAVPTSFSFHTCYANANLGTYGYELDALQYSSLSGCAADNNATGYGLLGCQGVTLTGCGTEAFTATGYLFNNCKGCGLYGGFTFNGKTKVAWVTNGTTRQTIGGLTETSPAAGATACVQTDAGTSSVLWGITKVTADNLAAGTFTNVDGSA